MRPAQELVRSIMACAQVPSPARRQEIERELCAHIEDFTADARQAGHQEPEIEAMIAAHFGEPSQIAEGFSYVYRIERRVLFLANFALSTVVLASALLAGILAIQTGLAFSLGTSIRKMLASEHTVIQALDVFAFVAVYLGFTSLESLFTRCRFQKTALLLTATVATLALSGNALGWHTPFLFYGLISGVFVRAVRLFVPVEVARAAIVLVCFIITGFSFALLHSPASPAGIAATCASWLAVGMGFLFMGRVAPRVDAALLHGLQRIREHT